VWPYLRPIPLDQKLKPRPSGKRGVRCLAAIFLCYFLHDAIRLRVGTAQFTQFCCPASRSCFGVQWFTKPLRKALGRPPFIDSNDQVVGVKAMFAPIIWECGPFQKAHFAAQETRAAGRWCEGGTNWLLLSKFRLSAKSLWNNLWRDAVYAHMRIGIVLPLLSLWTWQRFARLL
jgi:hypothetical protein